MKIIPFDKCLKKNNFEFFSYNSISSTMDEARFKINSLNRNLILLANEQTHGRGRRGNKWISPNGNIYCSIGLLMNIPNNDLSKIAMLTSVAVKHSLEHIGLVDIFFKWPNDILCYNKKISGIIQESYLNKIKKQILIIGVGINFLSSPKNITYKTTHITEYVKNISREQYFEIFINYFLYYFNDFYLNKNFDYIIEYKKIQMFLHTNIKIKVDEKKIINGKFIGINDDGSLILIKKNKKFFIYSGQILL